jgi:outer membrane autotransporter protein
MNLSVDGKQVPLSAISGFARDVLGGGASADEPGSLFGDRLGLWARGNYTFGEKSDSPSDSGWDGDQWGITAGLDYRFTERLVLGFSGGLGRSNLAFKPVGEGGLDTASWTLSLYGSLYAVSNFYVDAVVNYTGADYDSSRHIHFTENTTPIDRFAAGSTDGNTLSTGLSFGYDFAFRGITVSPNAGWLRAKSRIARFRETGASGLDLEFDRQSYDSSTANAGVRVTYAWSTSWGVLLPHFRGDYVRELQDNVETFGVRFANDPFADSSNPTPPIIVRSDEPDQSYFRMAAGMSAQFAHGISAYIDYQRYEAMQYVNFSDLSFGVRFQRSIQ